MQVVGLEGQELGWMQLPYKDNFLPSREGSLIWQGLLLDSVILNSLSQIKEPVPVT
jgi:hypothetical protein